MGLKEQKESLGKHIILVADNGLIKYHLLTNEEKMGYDLILVHTGSEVMSFLAAYAGQTEPLDPDVESH